MKPHLEPFIALLSRAFRARGIPPVKPGFEQRVMREIRNLPQAEASPHLPDLQTMILRFAAAAMTVALLLAAHGAVNGFLPDYEVAEAGLELHTMENGR